MSVAPLAPHDLRIGDRVLPTSRRCLVMGVVNVTPDSFSDGGRYLDPAAAVAHGLARRPQIQERLTAEIADALVERLEPRGALVVIEAEHLCMSMRGVRKPGAVTVTSAVQGSFRDSMSTRLEAMNLLGVTRLG